MDRLMVIDDEPELCRFIGRVGESAGYEVKTTTQAREFKEWMAEWKPGLVILDLAMPEVDGLELLRWIASEGYRARIVIMSGFDTRVVEAARQIGRERGLNVVRAFSKPIRVQELKEQLEAMKERGGGLIDEDDLERGIADHEFFLVYQPKVALDAGDMKGVEALVRWRHSVHGLVMPDQFIPLAERTGLIRELTDSVLSEAIYQQKFWMQQGLTLSMAVNLSPIDLCDERLADRIGMLCQSENIPPESLIVEITETAAMSNMLEMLDVLTRLRLKGVKLSIDDFGTGFSSLSRLRRLPVTEIKIDRSFVSEMPGSLDAFIIVKTIIGLANNMGLTVVAEGIETHEHFRMLRELGCTVGQGFGIARPMAAEEIPIWAASHQLPTAAEV